MVGTKRRTGAGKIIIILAAVIVVALLSTYIAGVVYFQSHYFFHTTVNGQDCSLKTVEELKGMMDEARVNYVLTLEERNDKQETISAEDIDLQINYGSSLDDAMNSKNNFLWFTSLFNSSDADAEINVSYDEELLDKKLDSLDAFDEEKVTAPSDAHISEYDEKEGFTIVPEDQGNTLVKEKTLDNVKKCIDILGDRLNLDEAGVYTEPKIYSDDEKLNQLLTSMNEYKDFEVVYTFGEEKEVLNCSTIQDWFILDEEKGTVDIDEDKLYDYVKNMASKHDTAYRPHQFTTHSGKNITITQGPYGWWTDQPNTRKELLEAIQSKKSGEMKPVYFLEAVNYQGNDYGDTYVEVDLGAQHLWFYKNGKVIVECDFVSGNPSTGHATPGGIYPVNYKERDHRMVGEGYDVTPKYFVPFNGDIGLHDAYWRSSFGGSIYKTGGSHGCVNMPSAAAEKLYKEINKGDPVICYY